jgi:uncharacterized membrane protein YbhN (UPF0104 family)
MSPLDPFAAAGESRDRRVEPERPREPRPEPRDPREARREPASAHREPSSFGIPAAGAAPEGPARPPEPAEHAAPETHPPPEHPPGDARISGRSVLAFGAFLLLSIVALYLLLPQIAGLEATWRRIEDGDPWWLALGLVFAALSFGGYVALFRGLFVRDGVRFDWSESYQITMAGLAATRLFAAGGAGGIVLTAWALRRSGMPARHVADKSVAFLVLTYLPYMLALVLFGFGLQWGLFPGPDPWGVTTLPATVGLLAIGAGLLIAFIPTDLQRRLSGLSKRGGAGRFGRFLQRAANGPAAASAGVREAITHLRSGDPALSGSILFWAAQIAVLWAAFRAFGESPPLAVLVLGFFVGMTGNLLPMPGGVGGVEGGMIGSLAAFGVDAGHAVVAVLVYRALVFWLPTLPGAIAYFQLRRTVDRWERERAPAHGPGGTILSEAQ